MRILFLWFSNIFYKYLSYANFRLFISLVGLFGYFLSKICRRQVTVITVINSQKMALAKCLANLTFRQAQKSHRARILCFSNPYNWSTLWICHRYPIPPSPLHAYQKDDDFCHNHTKPVHFITLFHFCLPKNVMIKQQKLGQCVEMKTAEQNFAWQKTNYHVKV